MTQAQLGARIGAHQSWVSDIELGRGRAVPLETWVGLGIALGRPLAMSFSKPLDPGGATVADAGHLEIQEAMLALAAATGRRATAELATRPLDPRHSSDVVVRDDDSRTLILIEAWNTFGDIGAAIRSTHRKQADASEHGVAVAHNGAPYRVATVWVVRDTAANRAVIARYPHLFATTFDGSSRRWVEALIGGDAPPDRPGLIWFDGSTRRLRAWRRARPV